MSKDMKIEQMAPPTNPPKDEGGEKERYSFKKCVSFDPLTSFSQFVVRILSEHSSYEWSEIIPLHFAWDLSYTEPVVKQFL